MISGYTTFLIDLDGVVYRGETLLPGARDFVDWLNANHKKYVFLTNNSFASESDVLNKLARLGIASDPSHVLGAGQAAVQNIARRFPAGSVYVIGEPPLLAMVRSHHLTVANPPTEPAEVKQVTHDTENGTRHPSDIGSAQGHHLADAVLVGLDRNFDYKKLTEATQAIRAGAAFIAVNRDPLLPVAGGLIPGCGAMVAAIEAASGVSPEVVGKPQPMLLQEAMRKLESRPAETVMVGDGLDTDIAGGLAAGTHTLLVLSGKDSQQDVERSPIKPEAIYQDLAAVVAAL